MPLLNEWGRLAGSGEGVPALSAPGVYGMEHKTCLPGVSLGLLLSQAQREGGTPEVVRGPGSKGCLGRGRETQSEGLGGGSGLGLPVCSPP